MFGRLAYAIARPVVVFGCLGLLPCCIRTGDATSVATASVGLDYASTSLGFRNSGALDSGRLLLWDQKTGDLVSLANDIRLPVAGTSAPANLTAKNVNGTTISANVELTSAVAGEIGALVSRDLMIDVQDVVRDTTSNQLTALSEAYRARLDSGEDAFRSWRVADATGDPGRFKYVLLVDPVRASSETIRFEGSTSASAGFRFIDSPQGKIKVEVGSNASASCSSAATDRALCFVNASVLTVFLNASGRLDYQPVTFSKAALAAAFRKQ